jgi:hypothetical protein
LPSTMPQRPANGGLLRVGYRSPGSGTGVSGSEIADSLRRIIEIFPFSGDWGRRPASICTAWPSLQCKLALCSVTARKSGMSSPHGRIAAAAMLEYFSTAKSRAPDCSKRAGERARIRRRRTTNLQPKQLSCSA